MTTTSLRPQLRSALLKQLRHPTSRKRNLLHKGFTLVELMIVIVIVGILSAVALPNFLNQTSKAKGTECTTKASAILKQVSAEAQLSKADADNLLTSLTDAANTDSELCTFTATAIGTGDTAALAVAGNGDLTDKYEGNFCVNLDTGKTDAQTATNGDAAAAANCAAA